MSDEIKSAEVYHLYSFKFIDFDLTDDDDNTCKAAVRMFKLLDFIRKFGIPYDVLCRWVLSV